MTSSLRHPFRRLATLGGLTMLVLLQVAPAAPARPQKHFLWRVTGLAAPFYLVGSLHSLTKEDFPLPEAYERALATAQRFVFEYNPKRRDELGRKFREAARYPSGQDIESELRPAMVALLRKNLWRFALSFDQVRHHRPWALALQLLNQRRPLGPSNSQSMESHLIAQARRSGKETGGLETIDEHVAFWREMLEPDGENLLLYTLTHNERVDELLAKTRAAWQRGDVGALAAINAGLRRANAGLAQRLLDRRNTEWVDRIEAEMKTGQPTAIIAGAGHFSGPRSVIALLRRRGHAIEQL